MYDIEKVREFVQYSGVFAEAAGVIAELTLKVAGKPSPELYLAAALVCNVLQNNHVCCQLKDYSGKLLTSEDGRRTLQLPEYDQWRQILSQVELVPAITVLDDNCNTCCRTLLVLDRDGGCYFQRQWSYECSIVQKLLERARSKMTLPDLPVNALADLCEFFETSQKHHNTDYQQLAVLAAMRQKLLVLSGGPGTGKTTVAAAILALKLKCNPSMRIMLAAPTAKAAVTLTESLHDNAGKLHVDAAIIEKLCSLRALTIHRMLGYRSFSHEFRHNENNPLDCDLLLVDECSMVDQSQMARLVEALPESADLILLGDRFQLASVEAGAVFADICLAGTPNRGDEYLTETFKYLTDWSLTVADKNELTAAPLTGALVELTENHRFAKSSIKLGRVAEMIRALPSDRNLVQETAEEIHRLHGGEFEFVNLTGAKLEKMLQERLQEARLPGGECFADIVSLADSGELEDLVKAFKLLDTLMLLAPGYNGSTGIDNLNKIMLKLLNLSNEHACGVPVMIRRNNYRNGLFNGDIGLIARDKDGHKKVFFPDHNSNSGMFRSFEIDYLSDYQTVFAMSVHKSQGSGFDEVIFVMPEQNNLLMNREMVYTAMTRARKKLTVLGAVDILAEALANQTVRMSNLGSKLRC